MTRRERHTSGLTRRSRMMSTRFRIGLPRTGQTARVLLVLVWALIWTVPANAAGTPFLVKDIRPGATGASVEFMTPANGLLFFSTSDPLHGWELWKSDGTTAGTMLVKDIVPGPNSSWPSYL